MALAATNEFSNDRPLTDKQQDRLNRAPFAARIARALLGSPPDTGLVVGIHGPWGDGKTSVLNLLRTELAATGKVVVLEFNPWRFTDEASMLSRFFGVLAAAIRTGLATRGERIAGWLETVGRYATVFDEGFGRGADLAKAKKDPGLEQLRQRLGDALRQSGKRIVALVDDIDRLDRDETYTMFRLIKACADLPNVSYVLAFDDNTVVRALGSRYGGGDEQAGRAFLEKIIQVPLKLPVPAREDLRAMCFALVDNALTASGYELSKDQAGEFAVAFEEGVAVRLATPRAAKRYGNALLFALPMLKDETNATDLLLVEALRAFYPTVYDVVREHHTSFSGIEPDRHQRGPYTPLSAELLKPLMDGMPPNESKAAKSLLTVLFPRLHAVYGQNFYGTDWLNVWAQTRRICSPSYCARYFTYAIPLDDVSDSSIEDLISAAEKDDQKYVYQFLGENLGGRKAGRLIDKVRAHETSVKPAGAECLAIALASLAVRIPNQAVFFELATPLGQAAFLLSRLLLRVPQGAHRVAAAVKVVEGAEPLWFAADVVRWCYLGEAPAKKQNNALTKLEARRVREVLVRRIEARAATGAPLFDPEVLQEQRLLHEWRRTRGRRAVQSHLLSVFRSDPGQVSRFLRSYAPRAWTASSAAAMVGELDTSQLKNMKDLVSLDRLAGLVRDHCPGNLKNPQWMPDQSKSEDERLAEQFIFIYRKWKKEGEPSDNPDTADE